MTVPLPPGWQLTWQDPACTGFPAWAPASTAIAALQCPATRRHALPHSAIVRGLQCKYQPGHDGDHAAWSFEEGSDVFWPQEPPAVPAPA